MLLEASKQRLPQMQTRRNAMNRREESSVHRGMAGSSVGTSREARQLLGEASIASSLGTVFNLLVLNLAFLVTSLPIVTLPITMSAAVSVIDGWRRQGEDRLLKAYWAALTSRSSRRATPTVGLPLVAVLVALQEVRFFVGRATLMDQVCLGLGVGCLLVVGTGFGYILILSARRPGLPPTDVWVLSIRWAMRNIARTGWLFLVEIGVSVVLASADPSLCFLGLPILLLFALYNTGVFGLQRLGVELDPKQAIPEVDGEFPGRDASTRRRWRVARVDRRSEP